MRRSGLSWKQIVYTIIFIAAVLQVIALLIGSPNMPETFDMTR